MATATQEEIVIIGAGFKGPGAENLEEFWALLEKGENKLVDIPKERWNHDSFYDPERMRLGKTYATKAGLVERPYEFDNTLFNINEVEADQTDPQQRWALECSYRAIEHAGLTRAMLQGSNTGVYIGAMNCDYRSQFPARSSTVDNYTITGVSNAIISARVSYCFDLRGPAMVLDTGCSSALTAIHTACQALRSGDCDLALAGGTNFIFSPDIFTHLSKAGMLSPTGQCHAFSDKADGYARGEGCGIVVLKRLSDAVKDKDQILATIATGTNQDGRTVTPISAPSKEQQKRLLEKIHGHSNPEELDKLDYIEAHGTGTVAGDLVETTALGEFFLSRNSTNMKYIGSVKSNIGHLESAAGIAGLIKVLLMFRHNKIVPSLFTDSLNKNLKFEKFNFVVPDKVVQWNKKDKIACINCFGFGGSNCHAIVKTFTEQCRGEEKQNLENNEHCVVCFSGKNEKSLKGSMTDFIKYDNVEKMSLQNVAYTSSVRRQHYSNRRAFVANSMQDLISQIQRQIKSEPLILKRRSVVFVFGGMGTNWKGMCQELIKKFEIFRLTIQEIDIFLAKYQNISLLKFFEDGASFDNDLISPLAIFACQIGLARLWKSLKVEPNYIVGQSVGEVAAAYFAGHLTLEDAVKVVYHRSSVLCKATGGKMVVVRNMELHLVEEILVKYQGRANISVVYSPVSCAISADADVMDCIKQDIAHAAEGIQTNVKLTDLKVPAAYHSHHMEEGKAQLKDLLTDLQCNPASQTSCMISTVTGEHVTGPLGAQYWANNLRDKVQFNGALSKTYKKDHTNIYIDISPKPVLQAHAQDIFPGENPVVISSMTGSSECKTFLEGVAVAFSYGVDINWPLVVPARTSLTPVPRYHFQKRHGITKSEAAHVILSGVDPFQIRHPFLYKINSSNYIAVVSPLVFNSVYDHTVSDSPILPGAFYTEIGLALTRLDTEMTAPSYTIAVQFEKPFNLPRDGVVVLDISMKKDTRSGPSQVGSYSVSVENSGIKYASISVQPSKVKPKTDKINISFLKSLCSIKVSKDEIYQMLKHFGFKYGPCYAILNKALMNNDACFTKMTIPKSIVEEMSGTVLHPSIIDAMIQTSVILMDRSAESNSLLPRAIGAMTVYMPAEMEMYIHTKKKGTHGRLTHYDVTLITMEGEIVARMNDLAHTSLITSAEEVDNIYTDVWKEMKTDYPNLDKQDPQSMPLFITDWIPDNTASYQQNRCILFDTLKDLEETTSQITQTAVDACNSMILILTNTTVDDSETEECILNKTLNTCMVLRHLYLLSSQQKSNKPIFIITKGAHPNPVSCVTPVRVNPVMTALWGMFRCCLWEPFAQKAIALDLHLPDDSISFDFLGAVSKFFIKNETLLSYPEWIVTEDKLYFNHVVPVDATTRVAKYRINKVDKDTDVAFFRQEARSVEDVFCVLQKQELHQTGDSSHVLFKPTEAVLINDNMTDINESFHSTKNKPGLECDGNIVRCFESVGKIIQDKNTGIKAVSCYPMHVASTMNIPQECVIEANLLPNYKPGHLVQMMLLWSLSHKIKEDEITILTDEPTEPFAKALELLLKSRRNCIVNIARLESVQNSSPLQGALVALTLLTSDMVSIMNLQNLARVVSFSTLMDSSSRTCVSFLAPDADVDIVDVALLFTPRKMMKIVPEIKAFATENQQVISDVLKILNPTANGNSTKVRRCLQEFLNVQVLKLEPVQVRAYESDLFRKDGVYLVVGGLTGLGQATVKYLAEHGAGNIAIFNRRAAADADRECFTELCGQYGCQIKAFQVDVASMESVNCGFESIRDEFQDIPVRGIFCGAAVLKDKSLLEMDTESFREALLPKVSGAWNLHVKTLEMPLDYFVLFSSVASILGNTGQTNYGTGNAFVDGLAHYRRQHNLPGQSINFGALDLGLLRDNASARKSLESMGFVIMSEDEALSTLTSILLQNCEQIIPCRFNKETLLKRKPGDIPKRLQSIVQGSATDEVRIQDDLFLKLHGTSDMTPEEKQTTYTSYLIQLATHLLGAAEGAIQPSSNLYDFGLDSIVSMTLINRIFQDAGCKLHPVVFFTGGAVVENIARQMAQSQPSH
ncbi:uncharacterized protein LOC131946413 [Physella acuta]|uniref:uncharacterized protein LOC131946413 n=1 Tax=Physella acuta TaxID=109671 RepID=UPI0027DD7109|nr:uncharacterized protein LOC131946413 [Physella acuta]